MELLEELQAEDDEVRFEALLRARQTGDRRHVEILLDIALHDVAEIKTIGGMAEVYESLADKAALALKAIFARDGFDEARVHAAAFDLSNDDARVSNLLYFLGHNAVAIREEMARDPDERIRLRASRAVLSIQRRPEFVERLLSDPSPRMRVEALEGGVSYERRLELLTGDPAPEVREAAARSIRFHTKDSAVVIEALRSETDPRVRRALIDGLRYRWRDGAGVALAILPWLSDEDRETRKLAAQGLCGHDLREVCEAIAKRIVLEKDDLVMDELLHYRHFKSDVPGLGEDLARLMTRPGPRGLRFQSMLALLSMGEAALKWALPLLQHEDLEVRSNASYLLSEVAGEALLPLLDSLAQDPRNAEIAGDLKLRSEKARRRIERQRDRERLIRSTSGSSQ